MNNLKNSSRREFLQQLGVSSSVLLGGELIHQIPPPPTLDNLYPTLASFRNEDGDYLLHISVQCTRNLPSRMPGKIQIRGGKIRRAKNYFLPLEQWQTQPTKSSWEIAGNTAQPYGLILWLTPQQEAPRLVLELGAYESVAFSVSELFQQRGLEYTTDQLQVSIGLLGTQEIGTLDPAFFNLPSDTQNFRFAVMADPQGGDPRDTSNGSVTRMKIHNAFIENSVALLSLLDDPAFCLVLGDIVDSQGQQTNFDQMLSFFKKADISWLFSVGNHETKYRLTFGADYNLSGFDPYLAAQQSINGLSKLLYSFNLGNWHFIVWPDPLRENFWQTHPHYFDWLERDLEAHKERPTFFLQHVPLHPIGIDPLINYVESVDVKRLLLDILARHGNVKYVLSGHVHIPLKASLKTAVSYRGMKLINLPAAGYRPRGFGEEDLTGGPVQGIAVVHIEGDEARLAFHTVTDEIYEYPSSFREFSPESYPLWLKHKWELEATPQLSNGNFSSGLEGWQRYFVYEEDQSPSNRCEVRPLNGKPTLYMFSASRGYRVPGQDRLPQTINRICQAVVLAPGQWPLLSFWYQVDEENSRPDHWSGAFVWIEGFERDAKKLNQVYTIGKAYSNLRDQHRGIHPVSTEYFKLDYQPAKQQQARLHISNDYEKTTSADYAALRLDRLVINLGVWTANEHADQRFGVYFSDIVLEPAIKDHPSLVGGQAVAAVAPQNIWQKGIDHIAGEHIHVNERYVSPSRR